jgi:mRNA interferase MazF
MAAQRGDVVLVPFPFSDFSTTKVRPAITSRLAAATGPLDYILRDWQQSGLRFPSAFKPVVATIEPGRVLLAIGALTSRDLAEVDQRLRQAFAL